MRFPLTRLAFGGLALTVIPALALASPALAQEDLRATILAQDAALFGAFNSCDGETFSDYIAEDVEFYHDVDGIIPGKAVMVEAVETSICNNFRRILDEESVEVWPVPGHGAIQTGTHYFINYGAETPHGEGRFLHVWQQTEAGWQVSRIVSYDHGPFDSAD